MGQECEGNAKNIHILRRKHIAAFRQIIGGPPQSTAHHLLAEQLAGESAQAQNMRHGLGIPALGEHSHRNYIADLLAALAPLSHGVHGLTKNGGGLFLAEFSFPAIIVFGSHIRCGSSLCLVHRLGINMDG